MAFLPTVREQLHALHELAVLKDKLYVFGGTIRFGISDNYQYKGVTMVPLGRSNDYFFCFQLKREDYYPNKKAINKLARRYKKVITKVSEHWKIPT